MAGSVELDKRSRVPEGAISDITIGVCFTHGSTENEEPIGSSHGFCFNGVEVLPSGYQVLNGTEYTKGFDDVVIRRGERREFRHTFTFTRTEADKLVLVPNLMCADESFTEPMHSGNIYQSFPRVTFE